MSRPTTVAVVGTGEFATAFARALLTTSAAPPRLVVLGRSIAALRCHLTAVGERPVPPTPRLVDLSSGTDLAEVLAEVDADLVVVAASLYSPYAPGGNRWSALLASTGFGLTTLLQAPVAIRAAEAAARLGVPLVNACYPDVVNPLLAALGLPVLCGLGNAHTLTSGVTRPAPLLAHHRHLKGFPGPGDDVLVLSRDAEAEVLAELHALRLRPRRELNEAGAAAGGALVARMLAGEHMRTNLPGPAGLPGGYPTDIRGLSCVPDLPAGFALADAVAWNQRHGAAEGVVVDADGELEFRGATAAALRDLGVIANDRVACDRWEAAAERLASARQRLSASPQRVAAMARSTA